MANNQMKLSLLNSQKRTLQDQATLKQQELSKLQGRIANIDKQIADLGEQDPQTAMGQNQQQNTPQQEPQQEDAPVGGNAGISDGALDASAQGSGVNGAKPDWKVYKKIGDDRERKNASAKAFVTQMRNGE